MDFARFTRGDTIEAKILKKNSSETGLTWLELTRHPAHMNVADGLDEEQRSLSLLEKE